MTASRGGWAADPGLTESATMPTRLPARVPTGQRRRPQPLF